ncbi:MAG TPA: PQQ-dependent sugar dehydrogenase, partial [Bacteroidales bacterium]
MKHSFRLLIIFLAMISYSCMEAQQQQLKLTAFATGLSRPLCIQNTGDDRLFVLEQAGKIKIIEASGLIKETPFLDISSIVNDGGNEQGLLGLAFHPDYTTNGYFYLNYTTSNGSTQVSRFSVSENNPDLADASSEFQILTIAQPYSNHNGGDIHFGPDGYLYIGMGDGGSGGDPQNRAQNGQELLGKMLRIDVDNGSPYVIPVDNPFVGDPTTLDEIWAIGVRNPWRFSFDPLTGDMWIADVGQNQIEEIDFQPASSAGGENYGWRCYEGSDEFNTGNDCPPASEMVFPVYEFTHSGSPGGCSVTGGVVYRGTQFPDLYGKYFFTDFCGSWIMSISEVNGSWQTENYGVFNSGSGYSAFGVDSEGEIYIAALSTGIIYHIGKETTSIDENNPASKLNIYPNPAKGNFTAEVFLPKINDEYQLVISDLAGRTLQSFQFENGENTLDVSTNYLQSGTYLVSLLSGSNLISNS